MSNNDEHIVVNLKSEDEHESVRNLSSAEKRKVNNVKEKLIKELGMEIAAENERIEAIEQQAKAEKQNNETGVQTIKKEGLQEIIQKEQEIRKKENESIVQSATERYSSFLKQYANKDDNTLENLATYGKYDSELDFKLNNNVKKVRFPMRKQAKIALSCIFALVIIATGVFLGFWLYEPPAEVVLTNIMLSQPTKNNYYVVDNVYVGDTINYSFIYMNCEYSDGSTSQLELTNSEITKEVTTAGKLEDNVFISSGEAVVKVTYQNMSLYVKYIIEDNRLNNISTFTVDNIATNSNTIDISKKVYLNAIYTNGKSYCVDINSCTFSCDLNGAAAEPVEISINNGVLDLSAVINHDQFAYDTAYNVVINYKGYTTIITITINEPPIE